MAFVEHSPEQPMLRHFGAECEHSNKSFIASSASTLEKHKDTNLQGLFATHALDCLSNSSIANDSTMRVASGSAIPHWMSSNHVQNIPVYMSPKSGSTRKMIETLGAVSSLPSAKLDICSEGHLNASMAIDLTNGLVNSRHLSQQQVCARPLHSFFAMPTLSLERDGGLKEEPKVAKEDALSHKQEQQSAKEHLLDLPILSLGLSGRQSSHKRAETSSWVSKFPFQIASSLGQAEHGLPTYCRKGKNLIEGTCTKVGSIASPFTDFKGCINHTQISLEHLHSRSSTEVVLPQKASLTNTSLDSAWLSSAMISAGANAISLKRDRNATLMQSARHPQLLPDFFAQQKVTASAAKVNQSYFAKSEDTEKISNVAFSSQKSLASQLKGKDGLASLHGALHVDKSRSPLTDHKNVEQQERNNGGEALKTTTLSSLQSLLCSAFRPARLCTLRLKTSMEDSETSKGAMFASTKSVETYNKFASSEGRDIIEAVPWSSASAEDRPTRQPLSTTAGMDNMVGASRPAELMLFRDGGASMELSTIVSLSLHKHSSDLEDSEKDEVSASKYAPQNEDWGHFLAAPASFGENLEIEGKFMLPFQQRFEQLQNFLKKCDGSDDEYFLRASCLFSKTAWRNQSMELESRAGRLSVEEGKEMKRAKLLNALEEIPQAFIDPHPKLMAPSFSAFMAPS